MAKGKITITGVPEKEPNKHENGNVDLIFKIEPATTLPKGLEPLKECPCLVRVAPRTWQKVAAHFQPESKLLIQGEVKSSVNKKGVAFLEVVAMDICLIEKKDVPNAAPKQANPQPPEKQPRPRGIGTPKGTQDIVEIAQIKIPEHFIPPSPSAIQEVVAFVEAHHTFDKPLLVQKETHKLLDGYTLYLAAKELHIQKVPITYTKSPEERKPPRRSLDLYPPAGTQGPWYKDEDVFEVQVNEILLTEPIHYEAKDISLPKKLKFYVEHPEEKLSPVVVRKHEGKYSLVMGIRGYFLAKILGREHVPAVLTDVSHDAFMKEHGWVERSAPAKGRR